MDDDLKKLVLQNDAILRTVVTTMEHLAGANDMTNTKLDKVVDALNSQNILIEKFNNLERELQESFMRVHKKIEAIEHVQATDGCTPLKLGNKDVKSLEKRVSKAENEKTWFIRIILTFIIIGILGSIITFI